MSALEILLDKDSWLLEIDTDWESGIKEYTWNWDNDEHPPLEEARKELLDLRTRIAELEKAVEEMVVFIKYTEAVLACDGEYPSIRSEANELLKKYGGKE